VAGVGAVVGGLIGLTWRPPKPLLTGMLLVLAWPVQDLFFAAGAPLALVVVLAFATGFGFSLLMVWWETALARHIPAAALSRVSAWDWMGSLALLPVGYLIAGPLADAFGARTVLAVGSAIGLVLLVAGCLPRSTRELGSEPELDSAVELGLGVPIRISAEQPPGDVAVELGRKA
jgi:predicted MFS family arabinose efflux permease